MKETKRDVRLVKVNTENFAELIALQPAEEQKEFVAENVYSLAEAYANNAEGRYAQAFGIYDKDTAVGFLMIGYDYQDEDRSLKLPSFVKNSYLIWRFMIDKKYQHQGYGREALKQALAFIRSYPCGKAEYCWLSYEPENEAARKLYRSCGFIEEKEIPKGWEEIPAVLKL